MKYVENLWYKKAREWKVLHPKISPQTGNAKKTPLNRPSKYKPPGSIALRYKVKQSKNGKSTSHYKASLIDFETQIFLRR